MPSPAHRPAVAIALAAALATVLAFGGTILTSSPAAAAVTLTASPSGSGTSCTASSPCALPTALASATAGSTVFLLTGGYGSATLTGPGGSPTAHVVVRPASGASVNFVALVSKVPSVTWTGGIVVTRSLYLYPEATGTVVDGLKLVGAGAFLRASHTIVR